MKTNDLKSVLNQLLNECQWQLDQTVTDQGLKNCDLLANVRRVLNSSELVSINNNMRVYQIVTSNGKQFFCNIEDLNRIVNENNMHSGYFKIYHFWNNKAEKVSQKDLKSFFEGAELKQEFHYQSR